MIIADNSVVVDTSAVVAEKALTTINVIHVRAVKCPRAPEVSSKSCSP